MRKTQKNKTQANTLDTKEGLLATPSFKLTDARGSVLFCFFVYVVYFSAIWVCVPKNKKRVRVFENNETKNCQKFTKYKQTNKKEKIPKNMTLSTLKTYFTIVYMCVRVCMFKYLWQVVCVLFSYSYKCLLSCIIFWLMEI